MRRLKDNASDAFLEVVTPTDIPALLAQIPNCHALVTTGEKASTLAAAAFSCEIPPVGGYIDIAIPGSSHVIPGSDLAIPGPDLAIPSASHVIPGPDRESRPLRFWRMPSTSRAYPLPLEKKADAYRQLFPKPGC